MDRFTEWNEEATAVLTDAAARNEGVVSYEDVEALMSKLPGVKSLQVVAKLVSLEKAGKLVYARKARTKKPRGEDGKPMTKASMVVAIAEAFGIEESRLSGLAKAPASTLMILLKSAEHDSA